MRTDRSNTKLVGLVAGVALTLLAPAASAQQVAVTVDLDHATYHAHRAQTAYLQVGLTGFKLADESKRAGLNVALVIDRSGSMQGAKIAHARQAALAAVEQLGPDDIVSVIAYDDTVTVLVPATKVSDRAAINRGIERLQPGGATALFAGTSKGAAEVRKFLSRERINRIVLLSDGLANVGPSSPSDLGILGARLAREGVVVTTLGLGLGYNEDLMLALAQRSGGNHLFVERPSDLARVFKAGFGSLASIVAQELVIKIEFAEGFRPLRAIGVDAEVDGRTLTAHLGKLYSNLTDELIIEFETPSSPVMSQQVADLEVSYHNMATNDVDRLRRDISAAFSDRRPEVDASENGAVMVAVVERVSHEKAEEAMQLRDQGRVREAIAVFNDNSEYLEDNFKKYRAPKLKKLKQANDLDVRGAAKPKKDWSKRRKAMRARPKNAPTRYDMDLF